MPNIAKYFMSDYHRDSITRICHTTTILVVGVWTYYLVKRVAPHVVGCRATTTTYRVAGKVLVPVDPSSGSFISASNVKPYCIPKGSRRILSLSLMVTHPGPIEGVLKTVYHQLAALARPVIVATCGAYCRLYELVSSKLDGLQQTFALTPKK